MITLKLQKENIVTMVKYIVANVKPSFANLNGSYNMAAPRHEFAIVITVPKIVPVFFI